MLWTKADDATHFDKVVIAPLAAYVDSFIAAIYWPNVARAYGQFSVVVVLRALKISKFRRSPKIVLNKPLQNSWRCWDGPPGPAGPQGPQGAKPCRADGTDRGDDR